MTSAITVKTVSTIVGIFMLLGGIGYGIAQTLGLYATKIALAQTDAKANYGLHALLERAIAEVTKLKGKSAMEKTADDWEQIRFLRGEIRRLRTLISGAGSN